ncbi:unnamed protein product [Meganyctiphanes norvegica]|uniref:Uncharacterized protein n=1 Tax=Meganyctiphanes norvegica TaxID=48144 RepID=A0AAV2RGJ0_MEGNR
MLPKYLTHMWLFNFIGSTLIFAVGKCGADGLACYICTSDQEVADDDVPFDPLCAQDGYNGTRHRNEGDISCYTGVNYNNRNLVSKWSSGLDRPECWDHNGEYLRCYCFDDLCNDNVCEQCFANLTTTTAATTTSATTTVAATTAAITTAATTTAATTTVKSTMPTTPATGLECYSCFDCPDVDSDTPIEVNKDYLSCFIAEATLDGSTYTFRGGADDYHQEGSCLHEDGAFTCFCTHNLCNDHLT